VLVARAGSGPATVEVPAVAGVPVDQASAALARLGLGVTRTDAPSPSAAAGLVLDSDPAAASRVERGTAVRLRVSSGPPPVQLDATALVGRPEAEVVAAVSAAGLVPVVVADGADAAPGTVTAVDPSGPLPPGTSVAVHVVPPPPPPVRAPAPAVAPAAPADDGERRGGGGKGGAKGKGKR
jgi:serine/threonine-protein kinase